MVHTLKVLVSIRARRRSRAQRRSVSEGARHRNRGKGLTGGETFRL